MAGQRIGRLVIKDRAPNQPPYKQARWNCLCDCGAAYVQFGYILRTGKVKSCGCLLNEMRSSGDMRRTHGMNATPEHRVWTGMRQRCENKRCAAYPDYGGRGISICERWASFENFYADMGPRPEGTTIERKDNDGPYSPDNCVWATRKVQVRNRRTTTMYEWRGETLSLQVWAERIGVPYQTVWHRYKIGMRGEKLLAGKMRNGGRKKHSPLGLTPPN